MLRTINLKQEEHGNSSVPRETVPPPSAGAQSGNTFMSDAKEVQKNTNFYKVIKPFLSAKCKQAITLIISDGLALLTDPKLVADSMNNFYSSIADNIGSDKSLPLSGD